MGSSISPHIYMYIYIYIYIYIRQRAHCFDLRHGFPAHSDARLADSQTALEALFRRLWTHCPYRPDGPRTG